MTLTGLAMSMTSAEAQVEVTVVTGIVTLLVSVISVIGARRFTMPKMSKKDLKAIKEDSGDATLSSYSGSQNEFMRLVMSDSQDVHAKLDAFDHIIEEMKIERTKFINGVGRYITKLALAWGSGGKMPYPDDIDRALLEETLPVDWRRQP